MIRDYYTMVAFCREQIEDRLRDAARERLVRQALAGPGWQRRFRPYVLPWLGRRLVVWGSRLLERYGGIVEGPALRAAQCSTCSR
jgi:hypothetical protein